MEEESDFNLLDDARAHASDVAERSTSIMSPNSKDNLQGEFQSRDDLLNNVHSYAIERGYVTLKKKVRKR